MSMFLANTGLGCLDKDKKLLVRLGEKSRVVPVASDLATYRTYTFPSGLSLFWRMAGEKVLDALMWYNGKSIWQARPAGTVPIHPSYVEFDLLMGDLCGKNLYVASIVKSPSLPPFFPGEALDVNVSAFPLACEVFDSRKEYESHTEDLGKMADGEVVPFFYLMHEKAGLKQSEKGFFARKIRCNLIAGEVLAVQKKDNGWQDTSFLVATVRTVLGNLDVVFGENQFGHPIGTGGYLVCEAAISAHVLAIGGKAVT